MSNFVLYSFYKNAAYVTVLAAYTNQTGYSGTTLFESWLGAFWNVMWTFLPIILQAILDNDVEYVFEFKTYSDDKDIALVINSSSRHNFPFNFFRYKTMQKMPFLYAFGSLGV